MQSNPYRSPTDDSFAENEANRRSFTHSFWAGLLAGILWGAASGAGVAGVANLLSFPGASPTAQQATAPGTYSWQDALAYCEDLALAGHSDWRLPTVKELDATVNLERNGPAINDDYFPDTTATGFYWTSTTHKNRAGGRNAVYICFGEGLGFFGPPGSPRKQLMDVHGAGAQRSDPKTGNAADFPQGHGPQGDVVRIEHHVRLMRDF